MTRTRREIRNTESATSVRFDDAMMWVDLTDGRTLGMPLARFPRLLNATPTERADVEISRIWLHWDKLDEGISVARLLAGIGDVTCTSEHTAQSEN